MAFDRSHGETAHQPRLRGSWRDKWQHFAFKFRVARLSNLLISFKPKVIDVRSSSEMVNNSLCQDLKKMLKEVV